MMKFMTLKAIAEACNGTYYGPADNLEKCVALRVKMSRSTLDVFLEIEIQLDV